MSFDTQELARFPSQPGVYLMKDQEKRVLYVGKAKNLKVRVKQYFVSGRDEREMVPHLIKQVHHIETIVVPSEKEALLLENTLIKKHQPKFNILLKDDKSFISLMVNHKHPWPTIRLIRYKGTPKEDGLFFGPYTSAYAARTTLELLHKIFPLRECSDAELAKRTRPCLLYGMKRCIAPCVKKCTPSDYATFVHGAVRFLKGHDKEILEELYQKMHEASEKLEFEQAGALLKTIKQIEEIVISNTHLVSKIKGKDTDVLGLYREGGEVVIAQLFFREGKLVGSDHYNFSSIAAEDEELLETFIMQEYNAKDKIPKELLVPIPLSQESFLREIMQESYGTSMHMHHPQRGDKKSFVDIAYDNAKSAFHREKDKAELLEKSLLDLADTLKLNNHPTRIECFDVSNISGGDLVASMVAFTNGERDKRRMRTYKIKGIDKGDDYSAMRQLLTRRLIRAKEENDLPDLIIVDGGKGQLNIAIEVFKELNIASIDLIALTKENARHDKGLTQERVYLPGEKEPIQLSARSSTLFFLQKIRDEAHRVAIEFNRKQRTKRTLKSHLSSLPGIGPVKMQRLLSYFGSIKRIKEAREDELLQVKGITKKDIETLLSLKDES